MDEIEQIILLQQAAEGAPDPTDLAQEIEKTGEETTPEHHESKKRKRSPKSDDSPRKRHKKNKKKPEKKSEKKAKAKSKRARAGLFRKRNRDPLFDYDPSLLELPTQDDFALRYGPSRASYQWGLPEPVQPQNPTRQIAPPPRIPSGQDDTREDVTMDPPVPVYRKHLNQPVQLINQEEKEKATKRDRVQLPKFLVMPLEVREEIYRNLLIAAKPIPVRAQWARIYDREKPGLETSILRVSKQIFREAVRVLYSENQFHYRLRDPPHSGREVIDIQRLAENDDDKTDYETDYEDSEEFERERGGRSGRRHARKNEETPCAIDIPKYGFLFRHLIIEAEHNRYSQETQLNMARAINVFTSRPGDGKKAYTEAGKNGLPRATNLHTFTVRVNPMTRGNSYTFVDFFKPESRVLDAMKMLSCQFLRVELAHKHLNPTTETKGSRLVMDMRYRRIGRRARREVKAGEKDEWFKDTAMLITRQTRINNSMKAVNNLEPTVLSWCRKIASGYERELHEWELDEFYLDDSYEHEGGFEYETDVESA